MAINSKQKGKRGELEWASFCRDQGYNSNRTVQYNGKADKSKGDVDGLPGVHIEVKRTEKLSLYDALIQANRDAKQDEIPIVAHRRNNCEWVIIMDAEDWFKLFREYQA